MIDRKKREAIISLSRSDPSAALRMASKLVDDNPDEAWTWSTRAHLHDKLGGFVSALSDIDQVLFIDFEQPSNHFKKASILISAANFEAAINCLTDALEIGEKFDFHSYDKLCLFFRSVCHCRVGDFDKALADVQLVDDDMMIWVDRMRSKPEIVRACKDRRLD